MALVTKDFSINITPGEMPPTVHVSEYDIGRSYNVTLIDENGSAFTIPTGTTATVEGTLNGAVGFTTSATIDGNQISFALTESMTAYAGKAWCKIKLTQNSQPIQTCAFILAVDRAGVEAETVIGAPGFEEQINQGVAEYFDNDPPFFELPSGGQSGQTLLSDGEDGAYWGDIQSGGTGLSDDAKAALLACFRNVAWINDSGENYLQALSDALDAGDIPVPPTPTDRIPSEYQKVEYIEATGTQMISTNITPGSNAFSVEVEFYKDTQVSSSQAIIGGDAEQIGGYVQRFSISFRSSANTIGIFSAPSNTQITQGWSEYTLASLYGNRVKAIVNFNTTSPYATGTITAGAETVAVNKTSANAADIGNGAINLFNVATHQSVFASCRIYSCKINAGETKIANFIPCYRKSDGEIGVYETVTSTFYANAGTGTFLKGGNVS